MSSLKVIGLRPCRSTEADDYITCVGTAATPERSHRDSPTEEQQLSTGKRGQLLVRFFLTNRSSEGAYDLRSIYDNAPYGYVLYKPVGDDDWKATSTDWGAHRKQGWRL